MSAFSSKADVKEGPFRLGPNVRFRPIHLSVGGESTRARIFGALTPTPLQQTPVTYDA